MSKETLTKQSDFRNTSCITQIGFSLIELLAVVTIIGIILALSAPTLFSVVQASKLTSAGEVILSRITQAQQLAQTMSIPVELRFYAYSPNDNPGADMGIRAVQLVNPQIDSALEAEPEVLSEPHFLPGGMLVAPSNQLSPLLQTVVGVAGDAFGSFPTAKYLALHFYPDGSFKKLTSATPEAALTGAISPLFAESFLTIIPESSLGEDNPKNFYCIQLDPYTSKVRLYRP